MCSVQYQNSPKILSLPSFNKIIPHVYRHKSDFYWESECSLSARVSLWHAQFANFINLQFLIRLPPLVVQTTGDVQWTLKYRCCIMLLLLCCVIVIGQGGLLECISECKEFHFAFCTFNGGFKYEWFFHIFQNQSNGSQQHQLKLRLTHTNQVGQSRSKYL